MLRPGEPGVEVLAPEVLPDEVVRAEGDEADDGAEVEGEHAVPRVLGEHAVEGGGHAKARLRAGGRKSTSRTPPSPLLKRFATEQKTKIGCERGVDFHLDERRDEVVEMADQGQS